MLKQKKLEEIRQIIFEKNKKNFWLHKRIKFHLLANGDFRPKY
jgi:hypothetical protein